MKYVGMFLLGMMLHAFWICAGGGDHDTAKAVDREFQLKEIEAKVAVANVQLEQASHPFVKPFVCTLRATVETNYACNKALDAEFRGPSR